MELNFGVISESGLARKVAAGAPFQLAVLGDFSARANRGRLETGKDLARRKPLRIDVDNIDQIIERLKIKVSLPMAEGAVEFPIASMDDFHPDQIYDKVELFSAMADLRRRLTSKSSFSSAAKDLVSWRDAPQPATPTFVPRRPRGATVPRGGKLSDFAALIGEPSAPPSAADLAVDQLLKAVVRPYVVKGKDPQQAAALESVDRALAATMRNVLHHPDFQILESLWRSVDLLTRRLETSTQLQIVLYDLSAEEFAADLSITDTLEETGLYQLLVEQPALDENQGALSVIIGAFVFDQTPPQAELLGRVAKLAARANAPFISAISPDFLDTKREDVHPLITEAWGALSELDEAAYLALVTPRFLLRQPYGERTDPISAFDGFEEFTRQTGLKGMLWGNPAFIAGLMMAQSYAKQGTKMNLGSILSADDMPYYFYVDDDGDQTALPCTERLMNDRAVQRVSVEHFIPLVSLKGRPEVRLGNFTSLAGYAIVGRWPVPTGTGAKPPPGQEAAEAPDEEKKKAKPKAADPAAPKPKPSPQAPAAALVPKPEPAVAKGPPAPAKAPPAPVAAPAKPAPAAPTATAAPEPDLDSLLASLKDDGAAPAAAPPADGEENLELDPELANLLKGI
jgi:type VI secretion system protein ImpC